MRKEITIDVEGEKRFQRSISLYKAFTAIALTKIKHQLISKEQQQCTVVRVMRFTKPPENVFLSPPENVFLTTKIGESIPAGAVGNGIADSTTLDSHPIRPPYDRDLEPVAIEIVLPFSRIASAFFLSSALSEDNGFRDQYEVIADISGLPVKKVVVETFQGKTTATEGTTVPGSSDGRFNGIGIESFDE
jgi:hypothetical protein